ncbi:SHOCT domain-containing protein [Listeria fleischmannii]|jgi:uncharacterized membrane protein|uniref:SHOCT domain-containing protein n=1 Tax=Listeria fleischmannii TaxID=1069827 RepID=A0A841YAQ0_9LIST|nr:hypothetical protein [Listeria fleischmannii]EIA19389.1 hypothetical protein KKC_12625 [Listeria fleischmannii subsp. coloradonensis]MBC1397340.1 hypothetical protein [Listeria fleischmannii]MBC1419356.1 hypothetical protein [Listeria fleischmannii]MBC1425709.1 hypothetical protein [Listeria fleischmannii]STY35349.1 Predicted membrane protein (DUF2078) [Listeria fleischmannii subsp. coloradonensis]
MMGNSWFNLFGGGMGGMMLMSFFWIIILIAIFYLIYALVKNKVEKPAQITSYEEDPEQVLLNEFMRGHISEEEYLHKKKYL